jgi:DNA-binding MarR family transcriptional regulator
LSLNFILAYDEAMGTRETADERTAETAWALVWQIFQADKARRWGLIAEMGLTPMQGMVMAALDAENPPTMSELAAATYCDNSSLTGVIDRLEALGHVERVPAPNDRRARCVALTPRGAAFQQHFREAMRPPPPQLAHLTGREAAQLHDLLAKAIQRHEGAHLPE